MKYIILSLTGFMLVISTVAQIRLPGIFGDHMVLQRSQPLPVWGWSSPGEKISITFNHQNKETVADKNGRWHLILDAEPAGGPFEFIVEGTSKIILHDVLVGEVWICSGQSNMEFMLKSARNADDEIKNADYQKIRQIKIPLTISSSQKEDISPEQWITCSSQTAGDFTAVGYFFARELFKRLQVPIGLINSTWGGTMVEAWTSNAALMKSPEFKNAITAISEKDVDSIVKERRERLEKQIMLIQKNIKDTIQEPDWKNPDYNSSNWPGISVTQNWENQRMGLTDLDGIVWYRKEVVLDKNSVSQPFTLSLGKIDDNDDTYVNGIWVGSTKNWSMGRVYQVPIGIFKPGKNIIAVRVEDTGGGGGFYGDSTSVYLKSDSGFVSMKDGWNFRIAKISKSTTGIGPNDYPGFLFNAMINPLIPYAIRGVIWYQGEANAGRAYQYRTAFPLMIKDWRQRWQEGDFPFYYVQLASFNAENGDSEHGSTWAELREAQTKTLSLPATGMSVTVDIGESNDIHPKNKQDVGLRLSAIALSNVYGQLMEYSGPVYNSMVIQGSKIVLNFDHAKNGFLVKDKYGYIKGFEIAGADHHFHFAKAFLEDKRVVVYASEISDPQSVRYAWADDAGDANLYNQEGFPAVPFRTDKWKGITDDVKYSVEK
ncbi:MAG TPA: sialate O-acetylesterase [Puia sp.]|nr:sialate O-acetylesterase [Puia sp.]